MIKEKKKPMSFAEKQRLAASQGVASALDDISSFSSTPAKPAKIETVVLSEEESKIDSVSSINNAHIQTVVDERHTESVAVKEENSVQIETVAEKTDDSTKIDRRTTRRKSGKFVDKFTFSFPEEEKLEFKAFAASHGITITDLIMYSLDYLKQDVEQGKINISRYGVKRLG
ncbi:hypothetical protein [Treponema sp.]|uniref:hypothetical protein n=1 Tax=Treponema sp. TaxID=166 RepID=UPI00388E5856